MSKGKVYTADFVAMINAKYQEIIKHTPKANVIPPPDLTLDMVNAILDSSAFLTPEDRERLRRIAKVSNSLSSDYKKLPLGTITWTHYLKLHQDEFKVLVVADAKE